MFTLLLVSSQAFSILKAVAQNIGLSALHVSLWLVFKNWRPKNLVQNRICNVRKHVQKSFQTANHSVVGTCDWYKSFRHVAYTQLPGSSSLRLEQPVVSMHCSSSQLVMQSSLKDFDCLTSRLASKGQSDTSSSTRPLLTHPSTIRPRHDDRSSVLIFGAPQYCSSSRDRHPVSFSLVSLELLRWHSMCTLMRDLHQSLALGEWFLLGSYCSIQKFVYY